MIVDPVPVPMRFAGLRVVGRMPQRAANALGLRVVGVPYGTVRVSSARVSSVPATLLMSMTPRTPKGGQHDLARQHIHQGRR